MKQKRMINAKPLVIWLYACCASIFAIVIIGGITRLTGSGLSMVEWHPLMGALPPMNVAEWEHVFGLYQETPEYLKVNTDMTLPEFKKIFFWEWLHRLWGRGIGVIYAVPFFVFLVLKRIPRQFITSFVGFLLLGGAQGLLGWYMVQSGLINEPEVSHYRLTAHLGLAVLILALLYRMALRLSVSMEATSVQLAPLSRHVNFGLGILALTMIWGAFVAGLDAGLIYNDNFPMMGDYPWPSEGLDMSPIWINFVQNHALVQFIHRCLAVITGISLIYLWMRSRGFNITSKIKRLFLVLKIMVLVQIGLGVTTLVTSVSLHPAVTHQACALILLILLLRIRHEVPPAGFSYDTNDT